MESTVGNPGLRHNKGMQWTSGVGSSNGPFFSGTFAVRFEAGMPPVLPAATDA
jgi:hypothetical protein